MKGMKFNLIFIFSSSSFFANFIEKLKRWEKEKRKIISLLLFVCFSEENSLRKAKKVFLLIFFFLLLFRLLHSSFVLSTIPYLPTHSAFVGLHLPQLISLASITKSILGYQGLLDRGWGRGSFGTELWWNDQTNMFN